jgi:uncharacterized protein YqiB (DUF1249 family)
MINDWFDTVLDEARLPASWRGRPGSFVSLMALYESNYQRLQSLVGEVRKLTIERRSTLEGDCELVLRRVESAPYTTELELTYEFTETSTEYGLPSAPDMLIRVYHDARLAEAYGWATRHEHPWLNELRRHSTAALDQRWARNIMLNKWLEYCFERGHRLLDHAGSSHGG